MGMVDGKVAGVTGAGGGIGRATAIALAANGAQVVVNDVGASVTGEGHDDGPAHRVVAENDRECVYADGEVVMVWVEPASGRSVPLPAAIRAACSAPAASSRSGFRRVCNPIGAAAPSP